jgi:hypothetical protein
VGAAAAVAAARRGPADGDCRPAGRRLPGARAGRPPGDRRRAGALRAGAGPVGTADHAVERRVPARIDRRFDQLADISQEQTPLERQREQIRGVGQFREAVEELVDEPISPTEPSRLLGLLTGTIVTRLQTLRNSIEDASVQANVDAYLRETAERTSRVNEQLDSATGTLDVVTATMDYGYAKQANGLRRLRSDHGDDLPGEASTAIDDLLDTLEHFATAREYFKTLYFRREFAALSTHLIYVSLAAILVLMLVIVHSESLPMTHLLVTTVQTVALAPFALLSTYVVRAATVVRRTRADGQFAVE